MDYFKQRRAFRALLTNEIKLSMGQNILYRELLDYANDEGILDSDFSLWNDVLARRSSQTESSIKKNRNVLVQKGLIKYTPGTKDKTAPRYRIIQLYVSYGNDQNDDRKLTKSSPHSNAKVAHTVTTRVAHEVAHKNLLVPDHDLTSNNNISRAETSFEQDFEKLWNAYPRRSGKAKAKAAYSQAILAQETTADAIMAKIDEYKAQIKAKNTGPAYIKTGGNWFDEKGWLDDYDSTPEPVVTSRGQRAEPEPDWVKPGYEQPKEHVSTELQAQLDAQLAQLRARQEQRQKESEQA